MYRNQDSIIYVFDMDGTLTPPRRPMESSFADKFLPFLLRNMAFIATGSDLAKVQEQIPLHIMNCFEGIFCSMGNLLWSKGETVYKNEIEIKNIKEAQIKDGVALIKFMYQLKGLNNKEEMTELSLSDSLDLLRQKQEGFVDLSFDNICAFNENSAIVHYSATEETNKKIEGNGLLLLDSGAHYLEGTTDITRTFGVGKISDEMKVIYTTVLKAHIALSLAIFPKGTKGIQLDVIARNQLWQLHQDYRHGTGHGVGYLLSVHEGPNSFNLRCQQEIEPGMITTCEPGLYIENKFGVRLENEILCIKDQNNEFGEFYKFEPITYVPFDPDCIKVSLLTKQEKEWLVQYHELVYKKVSRQLTKPERDWLKDICTSFK